MSNNKKRTGHTDYRNLSKIADNIRKTMKDQEKQEGIDSTSPEAEDAIFSKRKRKK